MSSPSISFPHPQRARAIPVFPRMAAGWFLPATLLIWYQMIPTAMKMTCFGVDLNRFFAEPVVAVPSLTPVASLLLIFGMLGLGLWVRRDC